MRVSGLNIGILIKGCLEMTSYSLILKWNFHNFNCKIYWKCVAINELFGEMWATLTLKFVKKVQNFRFKAKFMQLWLQNMQLKKCKTFDLRWNLGNFNFNSVQNFRFKLKFLQLWLRNMQLKKCKLLDFWWNFGKFDFEIY